MTDLKGIIKTCRDGDAADVDNSEEECIFFSSPIPFLIFFFFKKILIFVFCFLKKRQ